MRYSSRALKRELERIRWEAAAPPFRDGDQLVAHGTPHMRFMLLAGAIFFGLGAVFGLSRTPVEGWAWGSLAFVPVCAWGWLERGRMMLRWDAQCVERHSSLWKPRRFDWADLREVRRSDAFGRDRLTFQDGRILSVPDALRGRDALIAHARAVLEARETP